MIWIDPRDKPGLLLAMMKQFMNSGHISFEGSLGALTFCTWQTSSSEETDTLKRNTMSPRLDFVVVPLTEQTVPAIWRELSDKDHLVREGIIHVQIESQGKLVFGGYDNFHRDCTVVSADVPVELLETLKENGVIRSYRSSGAHKN